MPASLILGEAPFVRAFIVLPEELHSVLDQLFKHDISPSILLATECWRGHIETMAGRPKLTGVAMLACFK